MCARCRRGRACARCRRRSAQVHALPLPHVPTRCCAASCVLLCACALRGCGLCRGRVRVHAPAALRPAHVVRSPARVPPRRRPPLLSPRALTAAAAAAAARGAATLRRRTCTRSHGQSRLSLSRPCAAGSPRPRRWTARPTSARSRRVPHPPPPPDASRLMLETARARRTRLNSAPDGRVVGHPPAGGSVERGRRRPWCAPAPTAARTGGVHSLRHTRPHMHAHEHRQAGAPACDAAQPRRARSSGCRSPVTP